jgi:hypothetical protein
MTLTIDARAVLTELDKLDTSKLDGTFCADLIGMGFTGLHWTPRLHASGRMVYVDTTWGGDDDDGTTKLKVYVNDANDVGVDYLDTDGHPSAGDDPATIAVWVIEMVTRVKTEQYATAAS